MLINLRNALIGERRLPYDAEVEYLESTRTQYIEVPMVVDNSATVNITGYVGTTNRELYSFDKTSERQFNIENGATYYRWWTQNNINLGSGYLGSLHSYKCNSSIWVDGVLKGTSTPTNTDSTQTLYILNGVHGATSGRIYHASVEYGGRLIFDAIPVRKGTVGYLYDRVSGKLFGNEGSGDFVLGPDVVPVEYIESFRGSGGGQFLNTGIRATTSTKWEIDLAFTTTVTNQLMGSGHSGNNRFNIGIESNAFRAGFGGGWFTISNTRDTNRHLWRLESLSATQCEASIDGGAAVSYTSTFSPSYNPIIIGRRYANESMTVGARYYANKIWTSGDLVQRLLPVRVGTDATSWEGAMMDVLTRRIYRNAGTGNFGYGNDLKYPIPAE